MKTILMCIIAAALSITMLTSCTDPDGAKRVLELNNFTEIRITGYAWLSCSDRDTVKTGFIARAPNGQITKGAVCSGLLFKNSTIRFE